MVGRRYRWSHPITRSSDIGQCEAGNTLLIDRSRPKPKGGFVGKPSRGLSVYPEGIAPHYPGLPRFAATLGNESKDQIYPERVASFSVLG